MASKVDKKLALLALMSIPVVDRLDALKDMHETGDPKLEKVMDSIADAINDAIKEYEALDKSPLVLP